MLEVSLDGLHDAAQERADALPELRRSMRGRQGNEVGCMGELVAMRYLESLSVPYIDAPEVNHDLATQHGTVDVKTKERTVRPKPYYDCTVPDYVKGHQLPDIYLFVSLLSDKSVGCKRFVRAWVLGTISRSRFEEIAVLWTLTRTDPSNNWTPTIAGWNVPVSSLRKPTSGVS
jgi:hypothetical protein